MASSNPTYQYQPLDSSRQQIRLIELYPGQPGDPLVGALRIISILNETAESYETISYVWGDPTKRDTIELSRKHLAIPHNTYSALQQVRLRYSSRMIWIDAVCINQEDINERSQQVSLMGSIYGKGTFNLIHLDNDDRMGKRAVEFLEYTHNTVRERSDNYKQFAKSIDYSKSEKFISFHGFDHQAFEYLVELPWFRRLWVLQEAKLSPLSLCHLGRHVIPLLKVLRLVVWLHKHCALDLCSNYWSLRRRVRCFINMFDVVDHTYGWYRPPVQWRYANALVLGRSLERSEPKDGVFAVAAIESQATIARSADYSKSLASILQDATREACVETNDLHLLHHIHHRQIKLDLVNGLPSWVIRADLQSDPNIEPTTFRKSFFDVSSVLEQPTLITNRPENHAVLLAQGITTSTIIMAGSCMSQQDWQDRDLHGRYMWMRDNLLLFNKIKHGELSSLDLVAIATTHCADTNYAGLRASNDQLARAKQFMDILLDDITRTERAASQRSDEMLDVSRDVAVVICVNRRMFFTDSNVACIGLGPLATQQGDVIAILRGLRWPCVLRPKGDDFLFVGVAYVHGMMNGEVRPDHANKETVFRLR